MKKILLSLLLLAAAPALHAQFYAIGHTTVTYTDPARANRQIQTEIYYPAAAAGTDVPVTGNTYPVISFGHGFVMVWSAYQNIWEKFVPEGYIVAFPRTEGSVSPVHAEFGADLAFLVGKIQSEGQSNPSSLFYGHVGTTSAIMGHSMGGGSSFLAAENNSSVTTMVTFAAANTNPSSITAAPQVNIPALVIAGQNDCVAPPAQHQVPMYDSLASACKAYVEITGGGHCYFAESNFNCSFGEGTCTPNPTITRADQQDAAQDMALLWLDYYLKDDCPAWDDFQDSISLSQRITGSVSCNIQSPVITQNGSTLQSGPAATYQWLLNGNPVAGANSQTYTPVQNGVYSVQVTYYNNCPYVSNTINVVSADLPDAFAAGAFSLYPNPSADVFNISFFSAADETAELSVCSLTGETILVQTMAVKAGLNKQTVTCITMSPGTYLLVVRFSDGQTCAARIVRD